MSAKDLYQTPTATVVEIKSAGVVCISTMNIFLLSEPNAEEIDWGRSTYGDATTETWN